MQAIDTLLQRRSAKTLTDPAPDESALELLLECAARAPDHGRLRPWRFIVIRGAARERLGELMADQLRRKLPAATAETLQRERQKALRAPLIVVVAAVCNAEARIPADRADTGRGRRGAKHDACRHGTRIRRHVEDR